MIQAEVVDLIGALLLLHGHHLLRDPDESEDSDTADEPGPRGDRGGPRKHADRRDPQSGAATDARLQVSVAVGMLQEASDASDVDAIALLRGYAFREGRLIDAVAADLVQRRLPTDRIVNPEQ